MTSCLHVCSYIQVIICTERTQWNCCTHVSTFILNILSSKAQRDDACSPFIVFYTNGPPLSTSRTGPLHDCLWLRVNKPWPHTLTLSAVWFPIGQPAVSVLLCLCFHQHGAQTTWSFALQASTNTLCPLYCPKPNITSLITIKSLCQQSGMPSSSPGQKSWITSSLTLMDDNTDICQLDIDSLISKKHSC